MSVFILVLLLCFSAFLSSSETALFSLPSFTIRSYKYDQDLKKRLIAHLLDNPKELLVTILMLNILSNILVQNTMSNIFGEFSSWFLKVGVPLALTLFLGEVIPKSISIGNNKAIAYRVAPIIAFIARAIAPVRKILTHVTDYISRFLFFFLKNETPISTDELKHIIDSSEDTGVLNSDETELILGYLELDESHVREKMRPKDEILFYNISDPLSSLIHLFVDLKCSRLPVCDGGIDKIIGIISLKNFFYHEDQIKNQSDLIAFLDKPFFIPETTKAKDLLQKLREHREKIALVVDEYGSISGLVTQEDLMETVIGEIEDLRDGKELYVRSSDDVIIANGKLELDEFEDIFDVNLKRETSVVTLGGWLIEQFEDIPQAGEKFVSEDFLFYVLEADARSVKKIYVRRLKKQAAKDSMEKPQGTD